MRPGLRQVLFGGGNLNIGLPNLVISPKDFSTASWNSNTNSVTVNPTGAIAPDGTQTGNIVTENSATSQHTLYSASNISKAASAITYRIAVFARQNSGSRNAYLGITNGAQSGGAEAFVNLASGTVALSDVFGSFTGQSIVVQPAPRSSWLIVMTATSDTATSLKAQIALASGTTLNYAGNGSSSIMFWNCQIVTP